MTSYDLKRVTAHFKTKSSKTVIHRATGNGMHGAQNILYLAKD